MVCRITKVGHVLKRKNLKTPLKKSNSQTDIGKIGK
jgi:hypothetical protein